MYEVELKLRADHGPVRERLDALDARHVDTVVQVDTYYDAPHREFAETDEALRIRQESPADGDQRAYLTYKGPLVDAESKTREEAETAVSDRSAAAGVLAGLGFEPAAEVRKEREQYALGEQTVTLDAVEDLGEFVEVETEVGSADAIGPAREAATDLLEGIGLDPAAGIRTSYLGLLLASGERDSHE
jgi:adenylate cyclase class 2